MSTVPSVPQNVTVRSTGSTSLFVTWMKPAVYFREYNNDTLYKILCICKDRSPLRHVSVSEQLSSKLA